MAEITLKDIKKAIRTLDKYGANPKRYFYMNPAERGYIENTLDPLGIAKIEKVDGKEYFWGMEVVMLDIMPKDTFYISSDNFVPSGEEQQ